MTETMDTTGIWTAADSRALDAYARRQPNRTPLQRDERLWELLGEPEVEPEIELVTGLPHCTECDRPMRPFAAPKSLYPDTVARGGHGLCITHAKHRRDAASS
ncbi:hypothetical protein P3H15_32775 [Rhodococcus sp. T2V]|uniref:hypothetical protein n=1 Tax=Rhodococcus sp. T2V TaxID=3034164 RepID=UPI0023E2291C|nr:hypothetical protein [Rhodococcus sp. T2V]MDF3309795.1 hypothetical protein [Rhodococcus sp. T2V]